MDKCSRLASNHYDDGMTLLQRSARTIMMWHRAPRHRDRLLDRDKGSFVENKNNNDILAAAWGGGTNARTVSLDESVC